MSSADSILLAAINNKIDLFEIKSLSDLEEISNGCLFTLLQSFLDHRISEKVEVSFLIEICGPEIKNLFLIKIEKKKQDFFFIFGYS